MTPTRTFQGVTYTNGNLPKRLLAPLDGNNLDVAGDRAALRLDAAASWNRARAEVLAKTGIELTVRGWNRTRAEQERFYLQRHARWTPGYKVCCYWDGVPYRFTGTAHASPPGTSNHGWGLAVDVVDFGTVGQWNHPRRVAAIAILKRHGWTDDEGRGRIQEPWHLVYDPARDQHRNDPTPEDDMPTPKEIAAAVWDHQFQATTHDGARIAGDTAGQRLLEVRKDTDRTERLATETTVLSRRVERLTTEVTLTTRALVELAKSKGVDPDAIVAEVRRALENVTLEINTKG
jgi:hypothetical protein